MTEHKVRGHLIINVMEASGKNKQDDIVWDPNFLEGFVKVEIRGGAKNVKVQSTPKRVLANSINWQEELELDVLENASELRLMLCREKRSGTRTGTSVIAACGIFVNDILDAVPIDKYFELFKPGAGGEGGFIRIGMNFVKSLKDRRPAADEPKKQPVPFKPALSFKGYVPDNGASAANNKAAEHSVTESVKAASGKKKGFPFLKLVVGLAALGAGAYAVARANGIDILMQDKEVVVVQEEEEKPKKRFPF